MEMSRQAVGRSLDRLNSVGYLSLRKKGNQKIYKINARSKLAQAMKLIRDAIIEEALGIDSDSLRKEPSQLSIAIASSSVPSPWMPFRRGVVA